MTSPVLLCYWQNHSLKTSLQDDLESAVSHAKHMRFHDECGPWWIHDISDDDVEEEVRKWEARQHVEDAAMMAKEEAKGPPMWITYKVVRGDTVHEVRELKRKAYVPEHVSRLKAAGVDEIKIIKR